MQQVWKSSGVFEVFKKKEKPENCLFFFFFLGGFFKKTQRCKIWKLLEFCQRLFKRNQTFAKHKNRLDFYWCLSKSLIYLFKKKKSFWVFDFKFFVSCNGESKMIEHSTHNITIFFSSLNVTLKWQEMSLFPMDLLICSIFIQVWQWWCIRGIRWD